MGNQSSKNGPEFYKEFQRATISKDYRAPCPRFFP